MNPAFRALPLILGVALLGAACSNPTVDPSSTFTVKGVAMTASMQAIPNADVRLFRYYDQLHLLQPSTEDLFRCATGDCSQNDVGLEFAVVKTAKTGMDGSFSIQVLGSEIAAKNGRTDEQGKVEVSNLVVLVLDPADTQKRTGVYSFSHLFDQTDKVWDSGAMALWKADATADVSTAASSGLVSLSWNKLPRSAGSMVKNLYEVDLGTNSARLFVRCREGVGTPGQAVVEGGCEESGGKLSVRVSAYSLYSYYSDGGSFTAYVAGDGVDFRYRTIVTVPVVLPDPRPTRETRGVEGAWAVSGTSEQALLGTAALDNNPSSRVTITPNAEAIYVKFSGPIRVTDAGLLNSVVKDATDACVIVEFATTAAVDVTAAKAVQWTTTGRFCGATGAPNEMAAVMSFDTTASDGQDGAWMRFRLADDANVAGSHSPVFQQIGEIAIYKKRGTM